MMGSKERHAGQVVLRLLFLPKASGKRQPSVLRVSATKLVPSPDSKACARAELVDLIESQLNTLEKETFGVVTEAELCEYEARRDRIRQLYAEVIDDLEAAA